MSEIECMKTETENLKSQMNANQQGIQMLMAQIEACKGELSDARVISMQLRTNLILTQKSNQELAERIKCLENQVKILNVPES